MVFILFTSLQRFYINIIPFFAAFLNPFFFVHCGAYGQVAISLVLWYNYHTVKAEFIFWRMLFEEEQHLGDCIVNERFANTSRNPLVF